MPKIIDDKKTYYGRLVKRIEFLRSQFPGRTIVFNAETFRLITVSKSDMVVQKALKKCSTTVTPVILPPLNQHPFLI